MARFSDVYQSKSNSLKAADLHGKEHRLVIDSYEIVEFVQDDGRKQAKAVLQFQDREKTLVCNKTNGSIISSRYGEDLDGWIGKEIFLYPTTTSFGSDIVDCIRVRVPIPTATADEGEVPF
jgi:hypothetical protein